MDVLFRVALPIGAVVVTLAVLAVLGIAALRDALATRRAPTGRPAPPGWTDHLHALGVRPGTLWWNVFDGEFVGSAAQVETLVGRVPGVRRVGTPTVLPAGQVVVIPVDAPEPVRAYVAYILPDFLPAHLKYEVVTMETGCPHGDFLLG